MSTELSIKKHLQSGRSLTTLQALDKFRTYRLAEYVRRLRDNGIRISMTRVQSKDKWYGRYKLA